MPPKSRMPSKADLSTNWRLQSDPRATTGTKPPANVFRAFAKKPRLVNPYSAQPHLWSDFTICGADVKKCELCKANVCAAVFPQALNSCGHIFCVKCIYDHYVVADKERCPTCAAYISPSDNPCYLDDDDYDESPYHYRFDDEREEEERLCPCRARDCPGDCGTLPCGCIDTCRGYCLDYRERWHAAW